MPYVPPAQPSIRVIRQSPYKGGTRQWSQRYFFTGSNFTSGQFAALYANLWPLLRNITLDESQIVEAIQYDIGSDVPVATDSTIHAGTYPSTGDPIMPLEVCALWRLTTAHRTSKNHPIYGFKYFHNVQSNGGSDHESLRSGWASTAASEMNAILAGLSDGSTTRQWCDARGAVFQGGTVQPELTHRDFPNL